MSVAPRLWAILAVMALGLSAQKSNKPDFSGTWQLDLQRSRLGNVPPPKSLTIQIEHNEPQIRIFTVTTNETGETNETLELTTDGKQHAYTLQGQTCAASARWHWWRGQRLVVEVNCPGNSRSRRFTLGAEGRMLTTVLTIRDRSVENKAYEFFFKR
jgi:hypothetical protein